MEKYESPDEFTRVYLIMILVVLLSWSIMLPFIAKSQGLYWAVSAIAGYFVTHQAGQLLLPRLGKAKIGALRRAAIILGVLFPVSMLTKYVSIEIFLNVETALMILYGIAMAVFEIKLNSLLTTEPSC